VSFILLGLLLLGLLGLGIYFYLNNSLKINKVLEKFEDIPSDMMNKAEQAKKDLEKKQEINDKINDELIEESQKIGKYLKEKEKK